MHRALQSPRRSIVHAPYEQSRVCATLSSTTVAVYILGATVDLSMCYRVLQPLAPVSFLRRQQVGPESPAMSSQQLGPE